MSSTSGPHPDAAPAEIPDFPMARSAACPFDLPPALRDRGSRAPISRVRLWDGSTPWLVTRHADQRSVLADPRVSADTRRDGFPFQAAAVEARRTAAFTFVNMDGAEHRRQRRMVTAAFAIKRVEALRPSVQRIVDGRLDALLAGPKPADLVQALALPVPSLVICELLGVPYEDHDFFQSRTGILTRRGTPAEDSLAAMEELTDYLDRLLGEKPSRSADDLLSGLADRVAAGELTRHEAAVMAMLLLTAGHETTANVITLGTLALLTHPDQLATMRDSEDPTVIAAAVEELLRYVNIMPSGRRRLALEDIEVAGTTIRAGEGIILAGDIGDRDPEAFPDPDRLDLARDARGHLAFGFGVHQCLGQPLARLELQVVFRTLARRIPTLRLAAAIDQIPFKHDALVFGAYELPVTW